MTNHLRFLFAIILSNTLLSCQEKFDNKTIENKKITLKWYNQGLGLFNYHEFVEVETFFGDKIIYEGNPDQIKKIKLKEDTIIISTYKNPLIYNFISKSKNHHIIIDSLK